MASRGGYEALPDDAGESSASTLTEERQQPSESDPLSSRAKADNTSASASALDTGTSVERVPSEGMNKNPESSSTEKKDAADGLPTAEGIFVGHPVVQQSTAYTTTAFSGGYNHTAGAAHVVTSAPPPYSEHVAASMAAAAAAALEGTGIAIPQGGAGGARQHTVVLMNSPSTQQFGEWGRQPQPFVCQGCGYSGMSSPVTDPCSNMPILVAACCCLVGLWPCSFVPFLMPELRDSVHRCPNCHVSVGRSRQFC